MGQRPTPKHKLGVNQWLAANEIEQGGASTQVSNLGDMLMREYLWGKMSAALIQKIASAAERDGLKHLQIRSLQRQCANSNAAIVMNQSAMHTMRMTQVNSVCNSDDDSLLNFNRLAKAMPESCWGSCLQSMRLPMMQVDGKVGLQKGIHVLDVLFALMCHHDESTFKKFWSGDTGKLKAFWKCMHATTWCQSYPHKDDASHMVPLRLYGDAVQVTSIGKSWGRACRA
eukprot:3667423-Amphidinium_carterae.4